MFGDQLEILLSVDVVHANHSYFTQFDNIWRFESNSNYVQEDNVAE